MIPEDKSKKSGTKIGYRFSKNEFTICPLNPDQNSCNGWHDKIAVSIAWFQCSFTHFWHLHSKS